MDCEQIEQKLNLIIGEIYGGLHKLAATTRSNGDSETAEQCEQLAWDICKHWPTCLFEHQDSAPGGEPQQV